MKNLKTTVAGIVAGLPLLIDALVQAYNAGAFTGKSGSQLFLSPGSFLIPFLTAVWLVVAS